MMSANFEQDEQNCDIVYVAANMAHYTSWFELPEAPYGYSWQIRFNTGDDDKPVQDTLQPFVEDNGLLLRDRSVAILCASAAL